MLFSQITIDLSVSHQITADELIGQTLHQLSENAAYGDIYRQLAEWNQTTESYYDTSLVQDQTSTKASIVDPGQFLLKINGVLEYLLGDYKLIQYKVGSAEFLYCIYFNLECF